MAATTHSSSQNNEMAPFAIKDCALIALATGRKARLLQEFRRDLLEVETTSLYHHFWGGLLLPRFEEREYNNDFAAWVRHGIHDSVLAEQLAAVNPVDYPDLEALRQKLIDLIDTRLEEVDYLYWIKASQQFEFVSSQIVVLKTNFTLCQPEELARVLPSLSTGSIFYHFIDARRRTPNAQDDFSEWLVAFGDEYADLREQLGAIDPYFGSLGELREQLAVLVTQYFPEAAP